MVLLLGLLAGLAACKDAPTEPLTLDLLADGDQWLAVGMPQDLPDARTWLPYLRGSPADSLSPAGRVRLLLRAEESQRHAGAPERAFDLSRQADRIAIRSIARAPDQAVIHAAFSAVDEWRAQMSHGFRSVQPLAALAVSVVQRQRTEAEAAYAKGDTIRTAALLGAAAGEIRDWSPASVTLRVLARADERLQSRQLPEEVTTRAKRLVESSRREVLSGDPARALREAIYALQLASGAEVVEPAADPPGSMARE